MVNANCQAKQSWLWKGQDDGRPTCYGVLLTLVPCTWLFCKFDTILWFCSKFCSHLFTFSEAAGGSASSPAVMLSCDGRGCIFALVGRRSAAYSPLDGAPSLGSASFPWLYGRIGKAILAVHGCAILTKPICVAIFLAFFNFWQDSNFSIREYRKLQAFHSSSYHALFSVISASVRSNDVTNDVTSWTAYPVTCLSKSGSTFVL